MLVVGLIPQIINAGRAGALPSVPGQAVYGSGVSEEMERRPRGAAVLGHVDIGRSGRCLLSQRTQPSWLLIFCEFSCYGVKPQVRPHRSNLPR